MADLAEAMQLDPGDPRLDTVEQLLADEVRLIRARLLELAAREHRKKRGYVRKGTLNVGGFQQAYGAKIALENAAKELGNG